MGEMSQLAEVLGECIKLRQQCISDGLFKLKIFGGNGVGCSEVPFLLFSFSLNLEVIKMLLTVNFFPLMAICLVFVFSSLLG